VGRSEEKRPLRSPRHKREDNIKINLREVEWKHGLHRSGSKHIQLAEFCEFGNELSGFIKFEKFLD
jgi:hypothetical protein